MPSQSDHADVLLLPDGPYWESTSFRSLALALCGAASRMDDAAEQLLLDFLPDTAGTSGAFLDDWARVLGLPGACEGVAWESYTDAQKAAAIRAKLQGRADPNRANIEAEIKERLADGSAGLLTGLFPALVAGTGQVGDGVGSGQWPATWLLEYMPDLLTPTPDDFSSWGVAAGSVTVTDDTYQSPATELQTAAEAIFSAGVLGGDILPTNSADHVIQSSIWVRADAARSLDVYYFKRDGTTSTPDTWQITTTWTKLTYRAAIGVGASKPEFRLSAAAGTFRLSWAWAGEVRDEIECYAGERTPLNTAGLFGVIGEYSTAV